MSNNEQKTPFTRTLNQFAERKVSDAIQVLGKALPCFVVSVEGAIVTVEFDVQSGFTLPQVAVPLFGPEYIRYPIQAGCKGVVFPADARLGGVTGLGGGTADLTTPSNLGSLVFFPVGNTAWFPVDPNVLTMYGDTGVTMRNISGDTQVTLTDGNVTVITPGSILQANGSGASISSSGGKIGVSPEGVSILGALVINGEPYLRHSHVGVQIGSGVSGKVFGNIPVSPAFYTPAIPRQVQLALPYKFYKNLHLKFTFQGTGYFAQNCQAGQGGHFALVTRANLATITTAVFGQGMAIGNVSTAPNGNPVFPSIQIESWCNGFSPANYLLSGNPGTPVFVDDVGYDVEFWSYIAPDRSLQTMRFTVSSGGVKLYDSGIVSDPNMNFDPAQNGIYTGHVFDNPAAVPWTFSFTNLSMVLS